MGETAERDYEELSRLIAKPMYATILAVTTKGADNAWYERALGSLSRIGELLTAVLAAYALATIMRSVYRRTIGRRRNRYARLRRLGTNAQLSFFSSVLGEPPAMRHSFDAPFTDHFDDQGLPYRLAKTFTECVWIDRDFYVHAIADGDGTVHAYSVTTRSARFHPKLRIPGGSSVERRGLLKRIERFRWGFEPNPVVRLGKTRFSELEPPGQAASWVGAHNAHYFEAYWFGNPGLYQNFVFSINDAGIWTDEGGFGEEYMHTFSWGFDETEVDIPNAEGEIDLDALETSDGEDPPRPRQWQAFRHRARPNTYTVIGPSLAFDDYPTEGADGLNKYPTAFGVNSGRVRTV